jgi:hypothetical protein
LTLPFYVADPDLRLAYRALTASWSSTRSGAADAGRRRIDHPTIPPAAEHDPLVGMDEFHSALTLELEVERLEKIPTWPWPRHVPHPMAASAAGASG